MTQHTPEKPRYTPAEIAGVRRWEMNVAAQQALKTVLVRNPEITHPQPDYIDQSAQANDTSQIPKGVAVFRLAAQEEARAAVDLAHEGHPVPQTKVLP